MLTDERRAEIEEAIGLWEWRRVVAHIPTMARELLAEIDRLNEAASDSSELAATTIAGLEMENARLKAERDALMALLVKEEVHHDAATGTYPPTGRWWVVDCDDAFGGDVFEDRDKAVASVWRDAYRAVRKAAGLDPVLGDPVPPADGGPDA
jgi:hypothetical protein